MISVFIFILTNPRFHRYEYYYNIHFHYLTTRQKKTTNVRYMPIINKDVYFILIIKFYHIHPHKCLSFPTTIVIIY